jgi:hypothetical protein
VGFSSLWRIEMHMRRMSTGDVYVRLEWLNAPKVLVESVHNHDGHFGIGFGVVAQEEIHELFLQQITRCAGLLDEWHDQGRRVANIHSCMCVHAYGRGTHHDHFRDQRRHVDSARHVGDDALEDGATAHIVALDLRVPQKLAVGRAAMSSASGFFSGSMAITDNEPDFVHFSALAAAKVRLLGRGGY